MSESDGDTDTDTGVDADRERTGAEAGPETNADVRAETETNPESAAGAGRSTEPTEETDSAEATDSTEATDVPGEAAEETEIEEDDEAAEEAREQVKRNPTPVGESTLIAKTIVRVVTPLILLTAAALLLQGHNLPGGGFIAGVLTAAAFALLYIVYGLEYVETELLGAVPTVDDLAVGPAIVTEYRRSFAFGLALAAGAGIVAMGFDLAFLSQSVTFLHHLPIYGELELASAVVFDFGVFFVVVGALLTIVAVVGAE
ncbi:hypothetical protein BRD01_05480 [Halobacteriales archaeon QS_8_65_32]|jgi:multicomponent Na+:H+ antiporter subunit B|nr:MAG: hypothetical protein BRD01_05480 [Halobacteriales archaeon QS_8_65_32]